MSRAWAKTSLITVALAFAAAACGGGGETGGQSPEPTTTATPTTTSSPTGGGGGGGGGYGGGSEEIAASNISFDKNELTLPGGGQAELTFHNNDEGIPHNVAIYEGTDATGDAVFQGEIITGVKTTTYTFQAPPSGDYYFQCDVHPQMNGTVTVG